MTLMGTALGASRGKERKDQRAMVPTVLGRRA